MYRVLITYATEYGQTEKIAEHIAAGLRHKGVAVDMLSLSAPATHPPEVAGYDMVIIGAPIYAGKFPGVAIDWTRDHLASLGAIRTAFFSVSLNAADPRPEARQTDARMLKAFSEETGLIPQYAAPLIGAIQYRKYGLIKRWVLRKISASAGGPTDTSKNHELTDWDNVSKFAETAVGSIDDGPRRMPISGARA